MSVSLFGTVTFSFAASIAVNEVGWSWSSSCRSPSAPRATYPGAATPAAPAGLPGLPVPAGPAGPAGRTVPAGTWPALKSALSSESFRTFDELTELALSFDELTAFAFSWSGPTLFLGTTIRDGGDARACEGDEQRDAGDDHRGRRPQSA